MTNPSNRKRVVTDDDLQVLDAHIAYAKAQGDRAANVVDEFDRATGEFAGVLGELADTKAGIEQSKDAIDATANSVPYANLAAFPPSSTATRGAIAGDTGFVYSPGGATWGNPVAKIATGADVAAAKAAADNLTLSALSVRTPTLRPRWSLDFDGPLGSYTTGVNASLTQAAGILSITGTAADPRVLLPLPLGSITTGSTIPILRLRYRLRGPLSGNQSAEIYFATAVNVPDGSKTLVGGTNIYAGITVIHDGQWHTLDVDMSGNPAYMAATIGLVRLDLYAASPGTADLDYVMLGSYTTQTFDRPASAGDAPGASDRRINLASKTYGNKNNAVGFSVIVNESGEGDAGIFGLSDLRSASYADAACAYFSNRAPPDAASWPDNVGNVYTATGVTLPTVAGFENLRVGMILDTVPVLGVRKKYRGWIMGWDLTTRTIIVNKWATEGATDVTPPQGIGAVASHTAKTWGMNLNVFRYPDAAGAQIAASETGLFNMTAENDVLYADQETWYGERIPYLWGHDVVNLGTYASNVAFIQRGGFQFGFAAGGGAVIAFYAAPKTASSGGALKDTQRAFFDASLPTLGSFVALAGPGRFAVLRDGADTLDLFTVNSDGIPRTRWGGVGAGSGMGAATLFSGGNALDEGGEIPVATWDQHITYMVAPTATVTTSANAIAAGKYAGQRVTLVVQSAQTVTFKTGGRAWLAGGADFVMHVHSTLTLLWRGDIWVEQSRSAT